MPAKITYLETLSPDLDARVAKGHELHEAEKGIDCGYKLFYLTVSNDHQEVVGVLTAYTAFAELYIEDLWVDEAHRKHGYGKQLVQALEAKFKGQGYNNINLVTNQFSAPAFYEKCGFQLEFVRENKHNPCFTKYFYVKFLDEPVQRRGLIEFSKT